MISKTEMAVIGRDLATIPFYPREDHDVVLRQLSRFVDSPRKMQWLVDTAVASMRKWGGIPELRGLYCTRFKPADGCEESCSLPGFTAEDSEAKAAFEHHQQNQIAGPDDSELAASVTALAHSKQIGRRL